MRFYIQKENQIRKRFLFWRKLLRKIFIREKSIKGFQTVTSFRGANRISFSKCISFSSSIKNDKFMSLFLEEIKKKRHGFVENET